MTRTLKTSRRNLLLRTALGSAALAAAMLSGGPAPAQIASGSGGTVNAGTITGQFTGTGSGGASFSSGTTSTVTLGSNRTILEWSGFNLQSGNTLNYVFGGRSDIVLNRIDSGAATVNGSLNGYIGTIGGASGGNVWFSAPGGVVFGSNAIVNLGGLLATTGGTTAADFFDGDQNYNFAAADGSSIQVLSGAQINVRGGTLALIAPAVSTEAGSFVGDATANSGSDVLYGAAKEYTITFAPDAAGDLDLLSWTVPAASVGSNAASPIAIAGTTSAGNVYVGAVSSRALANAVITISGNVTATGAVASNDGDIILVAGGGISAGAPAAEMGSGIGLTTSQMSSNRDMTLLAGGGALLNTASQTRTVGRNYSITAGDFTGGAYQPSFSTPDGNLTITDTAGGGYFTGVTAPGTLTLNTLSGGNLTVNSFLSGVSSASGDVALNTTGGGHIQIEGTVAASAGGTVNLSSSGNVTQTVAGTITANTLTVNAVGTVDLDDAANNVTNLGASTGGGGFSYIDANGLVVSGAVNGGSGNVVISTGVGSNLTLNAAMSTQGGIALTAGGALALGGGGNVTATNGNVTLTGSSVTFGSAVVVGEGITLAGPTAVTGVAYLYGGSSGVTFNSTLVGGASTEALTISLSDGGRATFNGAIGSGVAGTALSSLIVNGGGSTLNALSALSDSNLDFGDFLEIGAATPAGAVNLSGATIVRFGSLESGAGPRAVNFTSSNIDAGAIGQNGALGNLTFNGPASLAGDISSTGAVAFNNTVTLKDGMRTIEATTATFTGTTNSATGEAAALTVNGNATFTAAVGATTALESLTVNGASQIGNGVTTTAGQAYNGATTLTGTGALTFASTGDGAINFAGTLNGGRAVSVNTAGLTTFGGNVGATTALTSLTINASGATNIGGQVSTTGAQSFGDAVTLTGSSTLIQSTGNGNIGFASTVDGASALSVNTAGTTTFSGAVGSNTALTSLTTNAGGTTQMGAGSVTTTGLQSYADNVVLGRATTLTGSGASFQSLSGSANDLTLNVSVSTAINGANFLGVRNLTVGGDGTAALSGAISTTGTQTYSGAVTLSANTVLTSVGAGAAGNVALRNVSGNGNNLTVNSSAGSSSASPTTIAFNGVVSGVSLLDVDSGVIDFNAALSAGDISLTALNGGIDVGADVTATASNTLDAAGAITGTGRVSGAAVVLIGDAGVGTAGNHLNTAATTLTASSSGGGVFINEQNGVTLQNNGALTNGAATTYSVSAGGAMSVTGPVSAPGGVTLATTTGNLAFAGTGQVSATSGDIRLTAADNLIGGGGPLVAQNIFLTADDFASGILGAATLQEANNVSITDTLGSLTISAATGLSAANGLSIETTNGALGVGGVSAPGFITLISASGLTLNDYINGGAGLVTLAAGGSASTNAGTISQTGGIITAGLLAGSAGAGSLANLSQANAVSSLGNFAANGFSFTNAGALSMIGVLSSGAGGATILAGGDISLTAPASIASVNGPIGLTALGANSDILLSGTINAGAGTVTTAAGAMISQSAGSVVTAGELTGSAGSSAGFNGVGNQIAALGAFATGTAALGGFALTTATTVSTVGSTTVNSNGGPITISVTGAGNDLTLNGTLVSTGNVVTLNAADAITQLGGSIVATGLAGTSGGATTLASDGVAGNAITALGNFTADGFSFAQDGGFLVTGAVNAGSGTLRLSATNGGVDVVGSLTTLGLVDVDAGGMLDVAGAVVGGAGIDLQAAGAVSIMGSVTAGSGTLRLASMGSSVSLGGAVSNPTGTLDLDSAAGVTQAVAISAGTLTGTNGGAVILANAGNDIGSLGNFSATGLSLRDTGSLNVTGAVNVGAGQFELISGGSIDQSVGSVITAGTFTGSANGAVDLFDGINQIANLGTFTNAGTAFQLRNGRALSLTGVLTNSGGDVSLTAAGSLAIDNAINAVGRNVTVRASGGDLALGSVGSVTGSRVILSTNQRFLNQSGADALSASAGWLVYSAAPVGNTFGGLDSGNTAIWNGTIDTVAAGGLSGNRYVFAHQPTLTFTSVDVSKTYGTDLSGSLGTLYTLTGLHAGVAGAFLGDTAASAFSGTPLVTSAGIAERAGVTGGPYAITVGAGTLASASGYALAFSSPGRITVDPRTVTGTTTIADRVYDGSSGATGSVSLSGLLPGDDVTATGGTFTFVSPNAGLQTVNVSGVTLSGTDSGNYVLSLSPTAIAEILRRAITGTVNIDDRVYDGTTGATGSVSLTGAVGGDDVSATGGTFTFVSPNAGVQTVNVSGFTLSGADAGNYTLTLPATAVAEILRRAITGTVNVNDRVYDGTTAATGSVSLAGVIGGDDVSATGGTFAFASPNAGPQTVDVSGVSLSGADASNYTLAVPASVVAEILRRAITASVTVDNRVYDGTTAATGSVSLDGVLAGDEVGVTSATFAFATANAGVQTATVDGIALTGTDAGNYAVTVPANVVAEILRRAITVTADAQSRTEGEPDPALTYAVTSGSIVAGDTLAGALARAAGESPGTYAIGQGTLSASSNYQLTFVGSTLTIVPLPAEAEPLVRPSEDFDGFLAYVGGISETRSEAPLLVIRGETECEESGRGKCKAAD